MKTELRTRLGKLLPRLASDHDGEVIATVAALRRTLAADGQDLHDLVSLIGPAPRSRESGDAAAIRRRDRLLEMQRRAIADHLTRIAELERDLADAEAECAELSLLCARKRIVEIIATAQIARPPVTATDRRAVVVAFLQTEHGSSCSDRDVGRRFGVSPRSVAAWRRKP